MKVNVRNTQDFIMKGFIYFFLCFEIEEYSREFVLLIGLYHFYPFILFLFLHSVFFFPFQIYKIKESHNWLFVLKFKTSTV